MAELLNHPLVLPIIVPIVAGILCLLVPRALRSVYHLFAAAVALVEIVLVWPLFRAGGSLEYGGWLFLRADPLSGMVLLAITVFGLLIVLYSAGSMRGTTRLGEYYAYLLWTVGVSCAAVLANEFILLLACWGFLGLTLYLLIGIAGPDASAAAKKTLILIGGSDSVLLLGIVIIWHLTGSTRMDGAAIHLIDGFSYTAFICLAIAAFAKAGVMPFHTWVPDCGEKAPASVAAFLPASLDKLLGIYLLFRVSSDVFVMNGSMNRMLMAVGAVTIICAVMMALVQHDMKRLLSYHAVSQVGYMVLGIGTGVPVGMAGALFHMINNTLYKTGLFLCAGALEQKAGTTDLDSLGGLAKKMPVTFWACAISSLAIAGIPPLNGFASKWMVYQGVIDAAEGGGALRFVWLAAAMIGSALTLASFVKVLHAGFLRKEAPAVSGKRITEVSWLMWLPMVSLAAACIVFGVFAYRLPLGQLVLPAMPDEVVYTGTWWAGSAAVMLVAAFAAGVLLYLIGTIRKARVCSTYVGGEILDDVYVSGTRPGGQRDIELTGVDFYRTVQEMQPFRLLYAMAAKKLFDLYDVGAGVTFFFSRILKLFHTGVLTSYVGWYIVGVIALILLLK
jgi:formate hydrogenlyase subunit 3/multisubunit Na+/H+ antiporter MnhD subunit